MGKYAAQDAAPDILTTTDPAGGTLKVTGGSALPDRPSDDGLVRLTSKSGPEAKFSGRSINWGCAYNVTGVWVGTGGGPGTPSTWTKDFTETSDPRIVLEVNEDGASDDVLLLNGSGTLRVWVLGMTGSYEVNLSANPTGIVGGLPASVSVTAGDSSAVSRDITGQSGGETTITASATLSGMHVQDTRTVKVLSFRGKLLPDDDPPKRSHQKLGVGETGSLEVEGTNLDALKPLRWRKTAGDTFSLVGGDKGDGTATFTAGERYEEVTLTLTAEGVTPNQVITYDLVVVPPSGVTMDNISPGSIWHVQNTATVGFIAVAYLTPKDVSFKEIEVRESGGALQGWGVLASLTGKIHKTGGWDGVGALGAEQNTGNGCRVTGTWTDQVAVGANVMQAGGYNWPAEWQYQINGSEYSFTFPISQTAEVDVTGNAFVTKGGHPESAAWGDQSTTPIDWEPIPGWNN